jgi:hypothetical protein
VTRTELLAFMRRHPHSVEATVGTDGAPQAAVVGIVVSDDFELFFDTIETTRKAVNVRAGSRVAFVLGGPEAGAKETVQLSGVADEPTDVDLEELKQLYFARFPDGVARQAWKGLTYVRVRPTWLRYSDFRVDPPRILEWDATTLDRLR